jgi:hypothetical protein
VGCHGLKKNLNLLVLINTFVIDIQDIDYVVTFIVSYLNSLYEYHIMLQALDMCAKSIHIMDDLMTMVNSRCNRIKL